MKRQKPDEVENQPDIFFFYFLLSFLSPFLPSSSCFTLSLSSPPLLSSPLLSCIPLASISPSHSIPSIFPLFPSSFLSCSLYHSSSLSLSSPLLLFDARAHERLLTGYTHKPPAHPELCATHERARSTVFSAKTWRRIAPELHVEDDEYSQVNCDSPHKFWENEKNQLLAEGYAEIKNINWGNINIEHIACAVANLQRHGWPAIFALVYDEVWLMAFKFIGMLRATNSHLQFNMDFWAWYIDPLKTDKGWGPHRDRCGMPFEADGTDKLPQYATVWVALSEATPTNGCIYVVPAKWDENYFKTGDESAEFDSQDLRALPVKAGDALAWSGRAIHFGGRAAASAQFPRMSIAFAASVPDFEDPTIRLGRPFPQFTDAGGDDVSLRMPTLRERLRVIAAQVFTYDNREPLSEAVSQVLEAVNKSFESGENGSAEMIDDESDYGDEDEESENVDN